MVAIGGKRCWDGDIKQLSCCLLAAVHGTSHICARMGLPRGGQLDLTLCLSYQLEYLFCTIPGCKTRYCHDQRCHYLEEGDRFSVWLTAGFKTTDLRDD